MKEPAAQAIFAFRWKYVVLPLLMLLLSVILMAVYYPRLPFPVAYHFRSDGSPDGFAIPGLFAFWALFPQFLLTLGAIAVAWVISLMATRFLDPKSVVISPQRIMLLTGNMVALPQIIIVYVLLDIFSFNISHSHLGFPVLAFALVMMLLGGIVLGISFVQMMRQVWVSNKPPDKK